MMEHKLIRNEDKQTFTREEVDELLKEAEFIGHKETKRKIKR